MRIAQLSPAPARARDRQPRGDRAGTGARPRRRQHGLHRVQPGGQRRPGLHAGARRLAHPRRELPHGRRRHRRGRSRLAGRSRHRAWLADRRQRRVERRLGLPRARRAPRARQSRSVGRHDAEQRHVHHGVVYVLNAGGTGNISGFLLRRHGLVPLNGSTQPLSAPAAGAVQVSFTPRGDQLVVSEKGVNAIVTYPVDRWGRAGAGTVHASAGAAPFGFSFGKHDSLNVTEAAASALTSYQLDPFAPITASLVNGGAAACWAASTSNGRFTFTANAATDSISAYSQDVGRPLSLVRRRRHGAARAPARIRSTRPSRATASSTSTAATPARSTRSRSARRLPDPARRLRRPARRVRRARRDSLRVRRRPPRGTRRGGRRCEL